MGITSDEFLMNRLQNIGKRQAEIPIEMKMLSTMYQQEVQRLGQEAHEIEVQLGIAVVPESSEGTVEAPSAIPMNRAERRAMKK